MYTKKVAYFSMGTGIYSDFLTYGGGLEILAGDMLKGVMDSNGLYPMTFIHILWKKGYVAQKINEDGTVRNEDPDFNNWEEYLIDTGKNVFVKIFNEDVKLKIWKLKNGPAYFLDADIPENNHFRNITWYLYGGAWDDREKERIAQEIVLGIGGVRALKELGISVDYYHYNDGHPAFAGLELISQFINETNFENKSGKELFNEAFMRVKKMTRFTTHTNVPAGNESHSISVMVEVGATLDLTYDQVKKIGGEPFNMTVASLNLSARANGVSRLQVLAAREMWKDVEYLPPIIAITNGVHPGTWRSRELENAFNRANIDRIYNIHLLNKRVLIEYINKTKGVNFKECNLTIAFARRATEYKRWLLIFKDRENFEKLIFKYNIQFVFAGKSHRYDTDGQKFIAEVNKISKVFPNNVVFLEGYDISLAQKLVSGVDIWQNNPRVPFEACGTSGMKAAMCGVLNVSTADGWWREGCVENVSGWTVPTPSNQMTQDEVDEADAKNLLHIYDSIVVHEFRDRELWARKMFAAMVMSQQYTTSRMIEEYFVNLYAEP